jgi:hypothetical protein
MNPILTVDYIHRRAIWNWLYAPWIIVAFGFLTSFIFSALFIKETYSTNGILSIYVYMLVMGGITVKMTFPFALNFGIPRKHYFLGTLIATLRTNAIFILPYMLFTLAEAKIWKGWGVQLYFFQQQYLSGNLLEQAIVSFLLLTNLFYFGFLNVSIYYRFRMSGILTFAILSVVLGSIFSILAVHYGWSDSIFQFLHKFNSFELGLFTIPLTLIYLFVSYLVLRRATV